MQGYKEHSITGGFPFYVLLNGAGKHEGVSFGRVFFEDFCFRHDTCLVGELIVRWLFVDEYLLFQLEAFLILKQSGRDDEFIGLLEFVIQMCATGFAKRALGPHG